MLRLSSSVKVFYDETWAMNGVEPQYDHGIKRTSTKRLQSLFYTPLTKNITFNGNEEADFVFI